MKPHLECINFQILTLGKSKDKKTQALLKNEDLLITVQTKLPKTDTPKFISHSKNQKEYILL